VPRKIAIFDYDHTLITGDSFMPFLSYAVGRGRAYAALAESLALLALARAQKTLATDARSYLKAHLLQKTLAGTKRGARLRLWQKENTPVMRKLREHHARGDMVVVASGGLDLYLPELLRDVPHDALICTDIGMQGDIVTGQMINGNCVRTRKAERVRDFLAVQGPFDESFGYGNYPHDLPMLALVKHRIIV
jgi:HAD superfamily phosphoserine phosphatase-like hydrolase